MDIKSLTNVNYNGAKIPIIKPPKIFVDYVFSGDYQKAAMYSFLIGVSDYRQKQRNTPNNANYKNCVWEYGKNAFFLKHSQIIEIFPSMTYNFIKETIQISINKRILAVEDIHRLDGGNWYRIIISELKLINSGFYNNIS